MIEQELIAIVAFDALNRTTDSIAKLQYFFDYKSSPCREIAKEQYQTDYNFIYLRGRDSRPLNYKVFSVYWVFRHVGIDVSGILSRRYGPTYGYRHPEMHWTWTLLLKHLVLVLTFKITICVLLSAQRL